MQIAMLCERMQWTFQDYMNQPNWLLDLLEMKAAEDAKHQDKQ